MRTREQELTEQLEEIASNMESVMAENAQLTKLLTAEPQLAGCVTEIRRLNKEVRSLRERNSGLMEEKNTAIRAAKSASRRIKE